MTLVGDPTVIESTLGGGDGLELWNDFDKLSDPSGSPSEGTSSMTSLTPSACAARSEVLQNQDLIIVITSIFRSIVGTVDGLGTETTSRSSWKRHLVPILSIDKIWFHTVIGFIWETMNSFLPLFSLLPSFKAEDTGYSFAGIRKAEWNRFNIYASRVKHFAFHKGCPFETIPERWLAFMLRESSRTTFFPNLQSVSTPHRAKGVLRLLPLALGAQLNSLCVPLLSPHSKTFEPADDWGKEEADLGIEAASALIANVVSSSPHLRELTYLGPISKDFMLSISELKELTSLTLTPTGDHEIDTLTPINGLPMLQKLKLVMLNDCSDTLPPIELEIGVPLVHLEVNATASIVRDLYHYLGFNRLESLECCLEGPSAQFASLSCILTRNPYIKRFIVTTVDPSIPFLVTYWTAEKQQALLESLVKGITSGNIVDFVAIGIPLFTGSMIREARSRCLARDRHSKLATFRLDTQITPGKNKRWMATRETLKVLAYNGCISLEHLELRFNDKSLTNTPWALSASKRSTHGLRTLGIISTTTEMKLSIHDKISIAMFLDALFPSLENVWGTAKAYWEEIDALVHSYQKARKIGAERCEKCGPGVCGDATRPNTPPPPPPRPLRLSTLRGVPAQINL